MILRKRLWAKDYESEKQFRDAMGVYELQYAKLEIAYLRQWIGELKLDEVWQRLLSEAQPLDE
ncbi:MAG TPA: hypothetical protein VHD56_04460 [Tepidisphaeraceae bacterium]|nr:hypothetical protein [Tepidisphaeraceae bacterium]